MRKDRGFTAAGGPTLMVLAMLREQALHGYDIARELERLSAGKLIFHQGTLYPILHKLTKQGLVKGEWETPDGDRARRRYSLTDKGRAEIEALVSQWEEYAVVVGHVLRETAGEASR